MKILEGSQAETYLVLPMPHISQPVVEAFSAIDLLMDCQQLSGCTAIFLNRTFQ